MKGAIQRKLVLVGICAVVSAAAPTHALEARIANLPATTGVGGPIVLDSSNPVIDVIVTKQVRIDVPVTAQAREFGSGAVLDLDVTLVGTASSGVGSISTYSVDASPLCGGGVFNVSVKASVVLNAAETFRMVLCQ